MLVPVVEVIVPLEAVNLGELIAGHLAPSRLVRAKSMSLSYVASGVSPVLKVQSPPL